jgi:ferredoxin-type protein NapH
LQNITPAGPLFKTGWLFTWKMALLGLVILLSVIIYRPFCKYLCPLGAIYGLLNPVSLYRLRMDKAACIHCRECRRACKMGLDPEIRQNEAECVRCGDCVNVCPTGGLSMGFGDRKQAAAAQPDTLANNTP